MSLPLLPQNTKMKRLLNAYWWWRNLQLTSREEASLLCI